MNITIISVNQSRTPVPVIPYGACVTAEAARREGHDVRVLDLMFEGDATAPISSSLRRHPPDVVGLSMRNLDNNDMLQPAAFVGGLMEAAGAVRAVTDAPVVLGGAAMAVMPEALLRATGADFGVLGDGETVFPLLLRALSGDGDPPNVPRVARLSEDRYEVSGNGPLPLAAQPEFIAPDYRRWVDARAYRRRMAAAPIQSKRGCPLSCVYCTYGAGEGRDYRLHPPQAVVEAVHRLVGQGFKDIEFVDNVFNAPSEHAVEVCEALAAAKTGARFQTVELNPAFVDRELLGAMSAAGFRGVGITAESAADRVLQGLSKGFGARELHKAAAAVRESPLPCLWVFLLGGPGETKETAAETIRFAGDVLRPRDAAFFNVGIRIYPGTGLEPVARQQGILTDPAEQMLEPAFYFSPEVKVPWVMERLRRTARRNRNVLYSAQALDHPLLPLITRIAGLAGVPQPLWRHTPAIRTVLRVLGKDLGQGERSIP